MLKKIFLLILFAFAISFSPVDTSFKPVPIMAAGPDPAASIDSGNFMFDVSSITHQGIKGSVKQSWIRNGINFFFEKTIAFMAGVIGTLCVLMLSLGGFLMLASAGDEGRYEQGKNYVIYSLIGLVVTLGAYIMVTLVQLFIRSIYG